MTSRWSGESVCLGLLQAGLSVPFSAQGAIEIPWVRVCVCACSRLDRQIGSILIIKRVFVHVFMWAYLYKTHVYYVVVSMCVSGARGEPEGAASVTSEGEQCGAPAGDPQRPGPLHTPLQHCSRAHPHSHTASLPGVEHTHVNQWKIKCPNNLIWVVAESDNNMCFCKPLRIGKIRLFSLHKIN